MNKKGLTLEYLVKLILIGVFAFIILFFLFPGIQKLLLGAGEKAQCQFSVVLSSLSSIPALGFSEIPPECKAERVIVDKKMLDDFIKKYKIEKVLKNYADPSSKSYNKLLADYYSSDEVFAKYRWAIAKIVADRLNKCRKKVLADSGLTEKRAFANFKKTACIVCSRIRFDSSILPLFKDAHFNFSFWLKMNKPKFSKDSYYDLLTFDLNEDEKSYFSFYLNKFENIINDPEDAIAVMYVHTPIPFEEDFRYVSLFPYKNITTLKVGYNVGLGEESICSYIID